MAQAKKTPGSAAPNTEAGQEPGEDVGQSETAQVRGAGETPMGQRSIEELEQTGAEIAPQLGTVAVVAAATALIEAELLPAVLIGAGAALLPKLLPNVGHALRPVFNTVIRAGYSTITTARQWAAEASEQVQDVIAEVQAEQKSAQRRTDTDTGKHTSATSGTSGS